MHPKQCILQVPISEEGIQVKNWSTKKINKNCSHHICTEISHIKSTKKVNKMAATILGLKSLTLSPFMHQKLVKWWLPYLT